MDQGKLYYQLAINVIWKMYTQSHPMLLYWDYNLLLASKVDYFIPDLF